jgi:hypothetical protein
LNNKITKVLNDVVVAYLKILFHQLPGGTKEKYENNPVRNMFRLSELRPGISVSFTPDALTSVMLFLRSTGIADLSAEK